MVKIVSSSFIISSLSVKDALPEGVSEVAFLGRSNVGKSSLINAITNKKQLAKSSSTPGKTRLINFYEVIYENDDKERFQTRFVDLPGFGYAKVSKEQKKDWNKNLNGFIKERLSIRLFVRLIDSRHIELEIDKEVEEYIKSIIRPDQKMLAIYTKSDKLTQKEIGAILKKDKNAILVSTLKKRGIDEASQKIFDLLFGAQI